MTNIAPPPAQQPTARRARPVWLWLAVALVLFGYGASTWRAASGHLIVRQPEAFYELLTEAVVQGRTSLSLVPDPRLAELANPWGGAQGIPRAHDATYYHGKYYLYFGVTPVVLVLAPWRLVTGTYLTDAAAILVLISFGYLLGLRFVLRTARALGWELSDRVAAVVALGLGGGAFLQANLAGAQFYQVPIAGAFACTMAAANFLLGAWLRGGRGGGAVAALAAGSFFAGAAVGARPNFVFVLPVFGLAGLVLARRCRAGGEGRGALALLVATVLPAALVGAALAGYNYARFGDPLEFGLRYQFAAVDMREFKLFGPEFFARSFEAYLLSPARYSLYYPFVGVREETFGLLPWAPAALLALGAPWCAWRRRRDAGGDAWGPVAFVAAAGLAALATLLFYSYQLERYELDFVGPFAVAAAVVTLAAWRAAGRWARAGLVLLLAWTALHSIAYTLPRGEGTTWTRLANQAPALVEQLLGWEPGPVEMKVVLPDVPLGAQQPLFATGAGRDVVFLQRMDVEHFRVGFTHRGFPGVYGDVFPGRAGETRQFVIDLGGAYPPADHPLFEEWKPEEVAVLRRRVNVVVEGRERLRAESVFYESSRLNWRFGATDEVKWLEPRFAGKIESWRVLPLDRAAVTAGLGSGPVRLKLRFPAFMSMVGEPLVSTGRHGAGDLVYVFYVGPGRVRFAHDSWNSGLLESDVLSFDPNEEQTIEVDHGGLHAVEAPGVRTPGELRLRFNGREVLHAARHYHPALASEVSFGYNAIRASTADVRFRGERLSAERMFSWPETPADFGPVLLTVRWPETLPVGRVEPLLTTGRTGAADVLWVRYVDAKHIAIGHDCWGIGGPTSAPIAIEPGRVSTVQISLGNLFDEFHAAWGSLETEWQERVKRTLRVRVDGPVVLEAPAKPHPTKVAEITPGQNGVGASTAVPAFSGQILRVERTLVPASW